MKPVLHLTTAEIPQTLRGKQPLMCGYDGEIIGHFRWLFVFFAVLSVVGCLCWRGCHRTDGRSRACDCVYAPRCTLELTK